MAARCEADGNDEQTSSCTWLVFEMTPFVVIALPSAMFVMALGNVAAFTTDVVLPSISIQLLTPSPHPAMA